MRLVDEAFSYWVLLCGGARAEAALSLVSPQNFFAGSTLYILQVFFPALYPKLNVVFVF